MRTHFTFDNLFFPENPTIYEIMWKNIVEPDRPQMTTWLIRIAFWIPKATDTHSGYVILIPFPQQQWLHERASLLHYTCIAWLVTLLSPVSSFKRPFGRVYCCSCLVWLLSYVHLLYYVCIAVFLL